MSANFSLRALPNQAHPSWIEEGEREIVEYVAHRCHVYGTPSVTTCTYSTTGGAEPAIGRKMESCQCIWEQIKRIEVQLICSSCRRQTAEAIILASLITPRRTAL